MNIIFNVLKMHDDLAYKSGLLYRKIATSVFMLPMHSHNYKGQYKAMFDYEYDISIVIDEDCFISRPQSILDMAEYMIREKIGYAGMPEVGVSSHRTKHADNNLKAMNSFFIMFNPKVLGPALPFLVDLNYKRQHEIYWQIFEFLYDQGIKRHEFHGRDHADNISTILTDVNDKDFILHTWYARNCDANDNPECPGNKDRILARYNEALEMNNGNT